MKPARGGSGVAMWWFEPQRLGLTALLGCLLASLFIFSLMRSDLRPLSIVNLQVLIAGGDEKVMVVQEERNTTVQSETPTTTIRSIPGAEEASGDSPSQTKPNETMQDPTEVSADTNGKEPSEETSREEEEADSKPSSQTDVIQEFALEDSKIECDFSQIRTNVCEMRGDVRVSGASSSILLVSSSLAQSSDQNTSRTIRPYARKWEPPTMSFIREFSLNSTPESAENSRCSVQHDVPAVVFSTGGFQGNFFHEQTDVLIPLFLTSHPFNGDVQFLIADFKPWWVDKYQPILGKMSQYAPINLDEDKRVHCFRHAVVGLRSHKELGIDPTKAPLGYSMLDFRRFLRSCYSLPREFVKRAEDGSGKKPRLVIMSRKKSRSLLNERQVVRMARRVGYRVIVAGPEETRNLQQIASIVNSCDVMVGVHGAGLSNMVFLPTNATIIQIVPWGELKYACRFAFGDPAMDMGLKYMEYEIGRKESSLMKVYPRNHVVFRDPLSIHKQGFGAMWSIFLDKQNVTLDVGRFRGVLQEALGSNHP